MPEYKLLARGTEGSQVFRRRNRLLLAMGAVLIPLDPDRLRQLFRVAKRLQRNFERYQQDQCVLINYEMIALRFNRTQLKNFILLLDKAISNADPEDSASFYPESDAADPSAPLPEIPHPPEPPLYSRN